MQTPCNLFFKYTNMCIIQQNFDHSHRNLTNSSTLRLSVWKKVNNEERPSKHNSTWREFNVWNFFFAVMKSNNIFQGRRIHHSKTPCKEGAPS